MRFAAICLLMMCAFPTAAADFVGAATCGLCHQSEHESWAQTAHAKALDRLSPVQQRDPACRSCHTTNSRSDDPTYAGVQCESCHGPGQHYAPRHVMRDSELSKLLGLKAVTARTCAGCHRGDSPRITAFDFDTQLAKVAHTGGKR